MTDQNIFTKNSFDVDVYKFVKFNGEIVRVFAGTTKAVYLTDSSGNFVINPDLGEPYKVPLGYSPANTIDHFSKVGASNDLYGYNTGGPYDLQRGLNGQSFGGFVPDFTPIASFDVGLACAAAKVPLSLCELGGGVVNLKNRLGNDRIDVGWTFGNNPKNVPNIEVGYDYIKSANSSAPGGIPSPQQPSSPNPPSTVGPDVLPEVGPSDPTRAPSASFVTYNDSNVATLKVGGSLSDIVAIENAKGNPITVEELRQVNGLTPEMDTKLRAGQQLLVPDKIDGKLSAIVGGTEVVFDPAAGTTELKFNDHEGALYGSDGQQSSTISYAPDHKTFTSSDTLSARTEWTDGTVTGEWRGGEFVPVHHGERRRAAQLRRRHGVVFVQPGHHADRFFPAGRGLADR